MFAGLLEVAASAAHHPYVAGTAEITLCSPFSPHTSHQVRLLSLCHSPRMLRQIFTVQTFCNVLIQCVVVPGRASKRPTSRSSQQYAQLQWMVVCLLMTGSLSGRKSLPPLLSKVRRGPKRSRHNITHSFASGDPKL